MSGDHPSPELHTPDEGMKSDSVNSYPSKADPANLAQRIIDDLERVKKDLRDDPRFMFHGLQAAMFYAACVKLAENEVTNNPEADAIILAYLRRHRDEILDPYAEYIRRAYVTTATSRR